MVRPQNYFYYAVITCYSAKGVQLGLSISMFQKNFNFEQLNSVFSVYQYYQKAEGILFS